MTDIINGPPQNHDIAVNIDGNTDKEEEHVAINDHTDVITKYINDYGVADQVDNIIRKILNIKSCVNCIVLCKGKNVLDEPKLRLKSYIYIACNTQEKVIKITNKYNEDINQKHFNINTREHDYYDFILSLLRSSTCMLETDRIISYEKKNVHNDGIIFSRMKYTNVFNCNSTIFGANSLSNEVRTFLDLIKNAYNMRFNTTRYSVSSKFFIIFSIVNSNDNEHGYSFTYSANGTYMNIVIRYSKPDSLIKLYKYVVSEGSVDTYELGRIGFTYDKMDDIISFASNAMQDVWCQYMYESGSSKRVINNTFEDNIEYSIKHWTVKDISNENIMYRFCNSTRIRLIYVFRSIKENKMFFTSACTVCVSFASLGFSLYQYFHSK